jgi:hypothetical protein
MIGALIACDETHSAPPRAPQGPMADSASSLDSMKGCEAMGKVTAPNDSNADFEMREKAAKQGATHVYRMPVEDQTGLGVDRPTRVYGQMFRCSASDAGAR